MACCLDDLPQYSIPDLPHKDKREVSQVPQLTNQIQMHDDHLQSSFSHRQRKVPQTSATKCRPHGSINVFDVKLYFSYFVFVSCRQPPQIWLPLSFLQQWRIFSLIWFDRLAIRWCSRLCFLKKWWINFSWRDAAFKLGCCVWASKHFWKGTWVIVWQTEASKKGTGLCKSINGQNRTWSERKGHLVVQE